MKNIGNWQFANRLSAIGIMIIAIVNIVLFYAISMLEIVTSKYVFLIVLILEIVVMCYIIEKKINQNETK
jgi:hypothetical protein